MGNIKVLGIDLAKNIFQLHGTTANGKCILKKRLARNKLAEYIANLPPCLIGMEATGGAHYWARLFQSFGHTVKLMAPQFVKPYITSNKNDMNDAKGIAEAVTRPSMKFVGIKTIEQQDMLLVHRARALSIKNRTAQVNQIRGLLAEYGIIIPKNIENMSQLPLILDTYNEQLTSQARNIFMGLFEQYNYFDNQIKNYDKEIEQIAKGSPICKELMKIPGIAAICATAAVATIGDANQFKNGREVSAWLGMVPRQHSSGDKIKLGKMSKRGDKYLRTMLIQGARSVVIHCKKKSNRLYDWIERVSERGGFNKAAVALANKNARIIWAIMKTGECYCQPLEVDR